MNEFDGILYETVFSTKETVERFKSGYTNEELEEILKAQEAEIYRLKLKYKNLGLSDSELMKCELMDYMRKIISFINTEYSNLIPEDRLDKLNKMLNINSVVVINDENDDHDFSADSKNFKVIVNLAKIGKSTNNSNPDIYTQMAIANGTLPHEIFHMIIQMLKPEELADERMIINTVEGNVITSRGMVGFMLNEGFVEKFSSELCQKYGLYYQIAPQYLPYVDVCNYIMRNYPQINENTIFSLDESDIMGILNSEERQKYYQAEMISFAVRHKNRKAKDIVGASIEQIKIDYSNIPKARLEEIKNYYLMKNKKLQETSLLKTENKHL